MSPEPTPERVVVAAVASHLPALLDWLDSDDGCSCVKCQRAFVAGWQAREEARDGQ